MTAPLAVHAEALASIGADQDAVIAKDIGGLFTGFEHPDFPDIARQAVPQIVGQHAGAAGLITSQWYDELVPDSTFKAKPYSDVDIGEIEKTVNWALFAPGDEPAQSRLTTASQRLVRNVTRNTVTRNAQDEGVLWARHARGDACAFCRVLAGRGIGRSDRKGLYESEFIAIFQGAKGSHPGEKYHRHCHCTPVPVRAGTRYEAPDYVLEWDEEYQRAVKALKERGITSTSGPKRGQPGFDKDWWLKQVVAEMEGRQREEAKKAAAKEAAKLPPARQKLADELGAARNWEQVHEAARMAGVRANFTVSNQNIRGTVDAAKQAIRAVDDVKAEFPTVKVASIGDGINPPDNYAWTNHIGRENYIAINKTWLEDPVAFRGSWAQTVKDSYHYAGTGDPAYDATIHELGHAVHNTVSRPAMVDGGTIERALSDYFLDTHPGANEFAYERWRKENLSGYSFTSNGEKVAEAFADAFINGDDAHDSSKVIYRVLTDALHEKWYTKPDDWGFTAPSRPPQVMNWLAGSAPGPALVTAGPQNATLAASLAAWHGQRGESVPTTADELASSLVAMLGTQ